MITIILISLVVLGALAAWRGHDSRDGIRTKEQDLASYGVTWQELADELEEARQRRLAARRLADAA